MFRSARRLSVTGLLANANALSAVGGAAGPVSRREISPPAPKLPLDGYASTHFNTTTPTVEKLNGVNASETFAADLAQPVEHNTTAPPGAYSFFDPEKVNILQKARRLVQFLVAQLIDSYSDKVMFQQNDSSAFLIDVREVKCGDAKCAPLHVNITLTFKETKNSTTITIYKALTDVEYADVAECFHHNFDRLHNLTRDGAAPPTKKQRRERPTRSAVGMATRAFDKIQDGLRGIFRRFLADDSDPDDPMEACTLPADFMDDVTDFLLANYRAELAVDPRWRPDTATFGAVTDMLKLLGKNMDVELPLLQELLEGDELKDVFVDPARRAHCQYLAKEGHLLVTDAQIFAEVDSTVPHPFWVLRELADRLARRYDGDDAREVLKVMAEDRRDYLLALCSDEGERRVCRCGASFTNSRDARNHIMKAGPCHEHYVLRWVDESMLHWCLGGCGNDRCDRGQFNVPRRPFFTYSNRRKHEEGAAPRPKLEPRESQYVGVSLDTRSGRWVAQIYVNKTVKHIGTYHDEELAACERDAYIRRNGLTGYKMNFPESDEELPNRTSSRFVGVWATRSGKWGAMYCTEQDGATKRQRVWLGAFDDEEEAAIAYNTEVIKAGLRHKRKLNDIDPVTRRPIPKY